MVQHQMTHGLLIIVAFAGRPSVPRLWYLKLPSFCARSLGWRCGDMTHTVVGIVIRNRYRRMAPSGRERDRLVARRMCDYRRQYVAWRTLRGVP